MKVSIPIYYSFLTLIYPLIMFKRVDLPAPESPATVILITGSGSSSYFFLDYRHPISYYKLRELSLLEKKNDNYYSHFVKKI